MVRMMMVRMMVMMMMVMMMVRMMVMMTWRRCLGWSAWWYEGGPRESPGPAGRDRVMDGEEHHVFIIIIIIIIIIINSHTFFCDARRSNASVTNARLMARDPD